MHKGRSYDESTESYGSTITYARPCVAELRVSESKEQNTYICTLNNRVKRKGTEKILHKEYRKRDQDQAGWYSDVGLGLLHILE